MRKIKVLCVFLCWAACVFAQDRTTIVLKKGQTQLYQGVNQEVQNWYLFIDSDQMCYLANLFIPAEELEAWFLARKDSQSIFKGAIENGMYPTLILSKENDPETILKFYVKRQEDGSLTLSSIEDASIYVFVKK